MAQILDFPYSRVRVEIVVGEAKILKLPERKYELVYLMPFAVAAAWLDMWTWGI